MTTDEAVTTLDDFESEPPRPPRTGKVAAWIAAVVAVAALAYLGAAWYLQDKVPSNTTVAGVALGGLEEQAAVARLTERLVVPETLDVAVGSATAAIATSDVELRPDVPATIARLTGFTLDPRLLWAHVAGAGEVEPVSTVDQEALAATLEGLRENLDVPPVEGAISLVDGEAQVTDPVDGTAIDLEPAIDEIRATWLSGTQPVELPTVAVRPEVGADAVAAAMSDVVGPLLSGPVNVTVGDVNQQLAVTDITAHATMEPAGGELRLAIDGAGLRDRLVELQPVLKSDAADARIVLRDGAPTVIPAVTGMGIDPGELATAVADAALSQARTVTLQLSEVEAEFTTEEAQALGVVEKVSEFSTPLTSDNVRTQNLINGTRIVNGTLIEPGEEFSLIRALGPVDAAHGFVSSGVVENGFATKAMGGGLSQLSTTMYNAAYFAGMDLLQHKPHSRWFSRYPEGREATVWAPSVDMVWKNSTPHGVLVEAWVSGGRTWVRLWSTHYYDVETRTSARYNITQPRRVYNSDPQCTPESGGDPGFSVNVTRWRHLNGALHDEEKWSWTYQPWNRVVCGAAP